MHTPLRVLVATGLQAPEIGGPATHTRLMEEYLPKYEIAVEVVPFRSVRHLPKVWRHIVLTWRLFRRAWHADIIFAQDTMSVGFPARVAALLAFRPFVVRVPGDHVWEQGRQRFGVTSELDAFPKWPRHPYLLFLRVLQLFVVKTARLVIVPSEYLHGIVGRWGARNVRTLYNGIDFNEKEKMPNSVPPSPRIVSVGRLVPWKGFDTLLQAVKGEASWQLAIIGDGPLRHELESNANELGMQERVRFVGQVPHAEVLGWCASSDVFVLASTYEGLPHTLIEAMARRVPVIASDIPGNREVLESDGQYGRLVAPGNATSLHGVIKAVLEDSERSAPMAARGAGHAHERFSVEKTSVQLADTLKSL